MSRVSSHLYHLVLFRVGRQVDGQVGHQVQPQVPFQALLQVQLQVLHQVDLQAEPLAKAQVKYPVIHLAINLVGVPALLQA